MKINTFTTLSSMHESASMKSAVDASLGSYCEASMYDYVDAKSDSKKNKALPLEGRSIATELSSSKGGK